MKTTLVAAALMGSATATAHIPARLVRRDDVLNGIRPDLIDILPEDCRTAAEAVVSELPAEPTVFAEFSSSYYKTVSRTATVTYEDCAWLTELPDSAQTDYMDYATELLKWQMEPDNLDLVNHLQEECGDAQSLLEGGSDAACTEEWSDFAMAALQGSGWNPEDLIPDDLSTTESPSTSTSTSTPKSPETTESSKSTQGSDATAGPEATETPSEGAASTVAVQTYAVAALLAAFVGTIALI